MKLALKETRLGLRNSTTRLPFRYGAACLTKCPQAVLQVIVEVDGRQVAGYSGDCLPPGWFDKSSGKDYAAQIEDMLAVIRLAERNFAEEFAAPSTLFSGWLIAYERVQSRIAEWGLPSLLASFGVSLCERALIDAMGRATRAPFHQLARQNALGLSPGDVHPELADTEPDQWLPRHPRSFVHVRHTVGLADPLTTSEIPADERLDDGFPQSLDEYVSQLGISHFKIKVSNRLDWDLERLEGIAAVIERHRDSDYCVTLDGNEQYKSLDEFLQLVDTLRSSDRLATLLANTLVIEQPLDRAIALNEEHAAGVREIGQQIPVIIDESDGRLGDYARAVKLGYRGVSSKACKGAMRSLLNAGLTWALNEKGAQHHYLMTGEDLCTVGIVPVQSDLCLVATLGLTHVERNGHHYHPGLSYLPERQQQAALAAHGDLYAEQNGRIAPRVSSGQFQIRSLQCPGFGFAVEPDLESYEPADTWEFASLGL